MENGIHLQFICFKFMHCREVCLQINAFIFLVIWIRFICSNYKCNSWINEQIDLHTTYCTLSGKNVIQNNKYTNIKALNIKRDIHSWTQGWYVFILHIFKQTVICILLYFKSIWIELLLKLLQNCSFSLFARHTSLAYL